MLAEISVPTPLSNAFTYRVPPSLEAKALPGARVVVELGTRKLIGVLIRANVDAPAGVLPAKLKDILDILDHEPAVPEDLLKFLTELSAYYVSPLGEVLRTALPALDIEQAATARKQGAKAKGSGGASAAWVIPTSLLELPGTVRGNSAAVLAHVRASGGAPIARLEESWKNARSVSKKLAADGLVRLEMREVERDPFFTQEIPRDLPPALNEAQAMATTALEDALATRKSAGFLLHGVTGSGKTEVYLRAIARAAELGRGALVLVPEIALTPQLVLRYRARFGDRVAVLHSGMSRKARHGMWISLRRGEIRAAIGARSALFAPVPELGLLIVDEEHDASFKQEEGVRYHARDMAMLRAHRIGAVCVLGSATPSLETEQLARTGKIQRLRLPERAHATAELPKIELVNLLHTGAGPTGDKRISFPLHRRMAETLARGEQTILFLNRRGFAPSVICDSCGVIATCPDCSVSLTFHRRAGGLMRCHTCDYQASYSPRCAACGKDALLLEGLGTEKLEETIAAAFPEARVERLDRDVASGDKAEAILERLRNRKIDVLIGTQMVAKGHDVASVTLVGVINADAALSMPDFRASERTFHLLVQVAGRAGRGEVRGTVILQTRDTEHPAIQAAVHHDVDGFAGRELAARAELGYPPFSRLVLVRVDDPNEDVARTLATKLATLAEQSAPSRGGLVEVLGPAPSPIARIRGRYRFQVLLRAKQRAPLRVVTMLIVAARKDAERSSRVVIDVDPVGML